MLLSTVPSSGINNVLMSYEVDIDGDEKKMRIKLV